MSRPLAVLLKKLRTLAGLHFFTSEEPPLTLGEESTYGLHTTSNPATKLQINCTYEQTDTCTCSRTNHNYIVCVQFCYTFFFLNKYVC